MGNRLCCGGSWSCPSTFQKENKTGSTVRPTFGTPKQQQQQLQQNGTKGHEMTGPMYERVLQQSEPQKRRPGFTAEDSNLHYADIQVYNLMQPRSASEVKHQHLETATEYATLHFPQTAPRYDSKNGTLV